MYVKAIGELWNFIPNKVANLIRILYITFSTLQSKNEVLENWHDGKLKTFVSLILEVDSFQKFHILLASQYPSNPFGIN